MIKTKDQVERAIQTLVREVSSLEVLAFSPEELVSPDPRSFSWQVKAHGIPIAD